MSGERVFRRLALLDKFCYTFPNSENHVPVCDYGGSINRGPMTRDDLRIRSRHPDDDAQPLEHSR